MIRYQHKEPQALAVSDTITDTRALYIDNQETVEITFEMDYTEAWSKFNQLPQHILPNLPQGYRWVSANSNYSVIRNQHIDEHSITIVLYGPDKNQDINFICLIDDVTTYSFAHTKAKNKPPAAKPPMSLSDYRVPGYDYSQKKYKSHVRGHLIDHQDTILGVPTLSTNDFRNYVPEPAEYEWGLGIRRLKVKALRDQSGGGAYTQFNCYSENSVRTEDGTRVPEDVRFYSFNYAHASYTPKDVYHVEFEEALHRAKGTPVLANAAARFMSSIDASPVVSVYSPDQSDRGLRLFSRTSARNEQQIENRTIFSRLPEKDTKFAACSAADSEFENAHRQLHAGVLTKTDKKASLSYLKRSLFFAEELLNFDDDDLTPYDEKSIHEGRHFFNNENESGDMDDFLDQFRQFTT